ncbi:hypothetical protein K2W90_03285 [Candidatus Babeliales bacterium]|nr:hypothetical protein [Candidatus Babeliales bacterium]
MNMKKILALALAFAVSQSGISADTGRLINTNEQPRKLFTKNVQVGQNDQGEENRKNFESTGKAFFRRGLAIGSGGNINEQGVSTCGKREEVMNMPFNPSTQLICVEFCDSGESEGGAVIDRLTYCGSATTEDNEFSQAIAPIITTVDRIYLNNGTNVSNSFRGNEDDFMETINTNLGCEAQDCDSFYGTNLNNISFSEHPIPHVAGNKKVYIGLYHDDEKQFYCQQYPFVFQDGGCIFINIRSCNLKSVTVVDLPNENFTSFQTILQEKIKYQLSGYSIFQIWAIADAIVANNYATTLTNLLITNTEESVAEACAYIQNLACYMFGC